MNKEIDNAIEIFRCNEISCDSFDIIANDCSHNWGRSLHPLGRRGCGQFKERNLEHLGLVWSGERRKFLLIDFSYAVDCSEGRVIFGFPEDVITKVAWEYLVDRNNKCKKCEN